MENNQALAPICLFVYSRLNETKITIESLQNNILASESQLFIFSDGAKNSDFIEDVQAVREYIRTIHSFANVTIYESVIHLGLANSIISGVTKIVDTFHRVIVLEDDLILATNFLSFMNQALAFYEEDKRILSISGYSFQLKYPHNYNYDVAFSIRASSWGWAIWKDRWEVIDWEVKSYKSFQHDFLKRCKFNRGGSDLSHMLDKQKSGKINSWAIRFCYHQYINNLVDVFPTKSKVTNNGFGENATHSRAGRFRFLTTLDISYKRSFNFKKEINVSVPILIQFYSHYSIIMRVIAKLVDSSFKKN